MKQLSMIACAMICLQTIGAQAKEGKITYEQKIDMYRRIPEENQQMRAMIPQFRTSKFELLFADEQSLFKAVEEEPDLTSGNNNNVVIRMGGVDNEVYRNFNNKTMVEKRGLLEEVYLIADSNRSLTWKLEAAETKTILGHVCKKAIGKTARGTEVVAWYTEEIPVAGGPEQFHNLPGMILGIDANKGEIIFTAILFDKKVERKTIKAPTQGKKVNYTEFVKIQKEKIGDGGGGVRIVTN